MKGIFISESSVHEVRAAINAHIRSLAFPMDTWLEEAMLTSDIYSFKFDSQCVGYCAIKDQEMHFFHVFQSAYRHAPSLLERVINEHDIKKVQVMTQDSQLCALMAEWDYEIERNACWFSDSKCEIDRTAKVQNAVFRAAAQRDCARIRRMAGDFFDDKSGGFSCLEERIDAETIFVLEENGELLGGGLIEYGQICTGYISIGMFANHAHRQKGVAKTILLSLKDYVYALGKQPIAGCWYYNTLSRKSLESAGMIATALGISAILHKKDKPPKRTGNPPGELVD